MLRRTGSPIDTYRRSSRSVRVMCRVVVIIILPVFMFVQPWRAAWRVWCEVLDDFVAIWREMNEVDDDLSSNR